MLFLKKKIRQQNPLPDLSQSHQGDSVLCLWSISATPVGRVALRGAPICSLAISDMQVCATDTMNYESDHQLFQVDFGWFLNFLKNKWVHNVSRFCTVFSV
jgi:hypothetical protein